MQRLRKSTLTDKLGIQLERNIRSGKFVAGRRLPSTRDIAQGFGVSQQVVKSAMLKLEGKGLIVSRERDGVYVNPDALQSDRLEFSLLSMLNPKNLDYVGFVLSVGDAIIWDGIDLATRNISEPGMSDAILRYELDKIASTQPDCLIINLPDLTEKSLSLFEGLNFPVVFIGDFARFTPGDDFKFSQIVEETSERGVAFVDAAQASGAKSLVLVGSPTDSTYGKLLDDGARRRAGDLSMRYEHLMPENHASLDLALIAASRRQFIIELLADKAKRPDAIAFDGCGLEFFTDGFRASGVQPGRDITVICDRYLIPGTVYLESDAKAFSDEAMSLIRGVAGNPDSRFGRKVLGGLVKRHAMMISNLTAD